MDNTESQESGILVAPLEGNAMEPESPNIPGPNPYAASAHCDSGVTHSAQPLPTFVTVMAIVSLIFCLLRLLIAGTGVVGLVMMHQAQAFEEAGLSRIGMYLEVISGFGMVLFGIPGNLLILLKKPAGFYLGWLLVVATLANLASGLIQAAGMMAGVGLDSPEGIGMLIGAGFTVVLRGTILVLYIFALVMFRKWTTSQRARADQIFSAQ